MRATNRHRLKLGLSLALAATLGLPASLAAFAASPMERGYSVEGGGIAKGLGSSELAALTAAALARNPDLAIATTRIEKARAQLRLARAEMLPVVTLSGGVTAGRSSGAVLRSLDFQDGLADLDVAYDLDPFGRLRAGRRAAISRHQAALLERQWIALAIEAEVARAYVQHAAFSERLRLLDRNIAHATELLRIIDVRRRLGEATRVDTGIQTIQLRQLEVERERLVEARAKTVHALGVLIGDENREMRAPQAELSSLTVPEIVAVQPLSFLSRRPDVAAAEAEIRAARGDVEQARAAFFPSLRLSAAALGEAASFGGPVGTVVTAGLGLLAPIFQRPRLKGELAFASAQQAERVELYRKTLLGATREVRDSLSSIERAGRREALLRDIIEEARATAALARRQYIAGAADLQWTLDAEQRLVQAEDAGAVALLERLEGAIDLHRALGGRPAAIDAPPALASNSVQ